MRNLIFGIVIGTLLNCLVVSAAEKIMVNPLKYITSTSSGAIIQTTKITTPEGVYRIFLFDGFKQGGITAVRIK